MYNKKTFIDLCIEGKADLSDIDEYIETWHTTDGDMSLNQFLGMTLEEYSLWVEKPQALPTILLSKKINITIEQAVNQMADLPIASCPTDFHDINVVMDGKR